MKLIYKIDTKSTLNKKAEELAMLLKLYRGCLYTSDDDYKRTVNELKRVLQMLNEKYPRTKPFEVYSESNSGIYISVVGNCEVMVAYLYTTDVLNVYDKEEGIVPISECIREKQ